MTRWLTSGHSEAGSPFTEFGGHAEVTMPTKNWLGFNRLYRTWQQMRYRCSNPNNRGFKFYGARGIRVCAEWLHFDRFQQWANTHGYRRGLTLERINNNENYSPENCTFADRRTQARNRRSSFLLTAFGATKTLAAWAEDDRCRVSRGCLRYRVVVLGIAVELAMSLPTLARRKGAHANSQFRHPGSRMLPH